MPITTIAADPLLPKNSGIAMELKVCSISLALTFIISTCGTPISIIIIIFNTNNRISSNLLRIFILLQSLPRLLWIFFLVIKYTTNIEYKIIIPFNPGISSPDLNKNNIPIDEITVPILINIPIKFTIK